MDHKQGQVQVGGCGMLLRVIFILGLFVELWADDLSVVSLKEAQLSQVQSDDYRLFYRIQSGAKQSFYEFNVSQSIYESMNAFRLPQGVDRDWVLKSQILNSQGRPLEEIVFSSHFILSDEPQIKLMVQGKWVKTPRVKLPPYVSLSADPNLGVFSIQEPDQQTLVSLPFYGVIPSLNDLDLFYFSKNTQPIILTFDKAKVFQDVRVRRNPIVDDCAMEASWQVEVNPQDTLTEDSVVQLQGKLSINLSEIRAKIQWVDSLVKEAYSLSQDSIFRVFEQREIQGNPCKQELQQRHAELVEVQKQVQLIQKIKTIKEDNFRSRSGEEQFNILYEGFKSKNILMDLEVGVVYSLAESKYLTSPSEVYALSSGVNYCFYITKNHCLAPYLNYQYQRWFFDSALDWYSEEWRGDYGASWYFPLLFRPGQETMLLSLKIDVFGSYYDNTVRSYQTLSHQGHTYGAGTSFIVRWSDSPLGYLSSIQYTQNKEFQMNLGLMLGWGGFK